jgi:hypothetical protein
MIEGIERLETEFERCRFRESSHLMQSHIVVVDPRPIEETERGSPKRAQWVRAEQRRVEGQRICARVVIDVQWTQTRIVVGQVDADAVDAIVLDLDERIVPEALKGDWQSRRKACLCLPKTPIYVRRLELCLFFVLSRDAHFSRDTPCHRVFDRAFARCP